MKETCRKILLDIGAHHGESLTYSLDPRFGFDNIYSFEPSPQCWEHLAKFRDPRLTICRFGLGAKTEDRLLYGSGQVGASFFQDKSGLDQSDIEEVRVMGIVEWLRENISSSDRLFLKLNCEGSELEIIEAFMSSAFARQCEGLILTLDALKVASLQSRVDALRDLINSSPFPSVVRDERHTSKQFVSWLKSTGDAGFSAGSILFALGRGQPRYFVLRQRVTEALPAPVTRILFFLFSRAHWHKRFHRP